MQARSVDGDYYDLLEDGNSRVAILVSDIAGKGIAASLLMANLQATLRSQWTSAADHPEGMLAFVNRMLSENTEPNAYATLFYAEYDTKSGRLRYANCGHLPGLLLHSGEVEKLQANNTVVGLFDRWQCTIADTAMQNGDTLVLYTDGVTEAFADSGEEFGEARLLNTLHKDGDLSARRLAEAIVEQVASFGGDEQHDDITVVVARRRG